MIGGVGPLFRPDTVVVLGAGASHELGLPVGTRLAEAIANLTYFQFDGFGKLEKGDHEFFNVLRRNFQDNEILNRHLRACRRIHQGVLLAESIDNYIDRSKNHEVSFCGKPSIAHLILKAERDSQIYRGQGSINPPSISALPDCWYLGFLNILCERISVDRLDEVFSNLMVVDFNYDRCLIQFLRLALAQAYHLEPQQSVELVERLTVIRPYGQVGLLPTTSNRDGIDFGADGSGDSVVKISAGLKTYTEQIDDPTLQAEMANAVGRATQIIFLGFAFHRQNLELLGQATDDCRVLGTSLGFSDPDSSAIIDQIRNTLFAGQRAGPIALLNKLTCRQLMADYRRTIAA